MFASNEAADKWPDLDFDLLRDVFNTHKVFMFGAFKQCQYDLDEFKKEMVGAAGEGQTNHSSIPSVCTV